MLSVSRAGLRVRVPTRRRFSKFDGRQGVRHALFFFRRQSGDNFIDDACVRYVAQLEHRIEQIEEFLRPLREGRVEITPLKSSPISKENNDLYRHHDSNTDTEKLQSHNRNQNNPTNEMGEADTSEDSIDGMAAISFQHERDAGFFGILLLFLFSLGGKRREADCLQDRRRILRSCGTFQKPLVKPPIVTLLYCLSLLLMKSMGLE